MDPISQRSLAANILAVVDFGYKFISSAAEVYTSASGTTAQNDHILATVGKLEEASRCLSVSVTQPQSQDDAPLADISTKCLALSKKLLGIARSLQVKKQGSLRESLRVAFRAWRKKDEISDLKTTVNEYREQILLEISLLLR